MTYCERWPVDHALLPTERQQFLQDQQFISGGEERKTATGEGKTTLVAPDKTSTVFVPSLAAAPVSEQGHCQGHCHCWNERDTGELATEITD